MTIGVEKSQKVLENWFWPGTCRYFWHCLYPCICYFSYIWWDWASAVQPAEFCVPFGTFAHSAISQNAIAICSVRNFIIKMLRFMFFYISIDKNTVNSLERK